MHKNTKYNHLKQWETRGCTGTILPNGYKQTTKYGIRSYEHRQVAEEKIGRKLLKGEQVHHKECAFLTNMSYPTAHKYIKEANHGK